tara:strand:+ start:4829 stop:6382 length:1554 start_codon:yes stop_codon:yes gene_type:complete
MSKFASFGKAFAGITPDTTKIISNMGVGLSNIVLKSAEQRSRDIQLFKDEEDAVDKAASELTKKADEMIDKIDDPELQGKFGGAAEELQPGGEIKEEDDNVGKENEKPEKQKSNFFRVGRFSKKELEESAMNLDNLDILQNTVIKLKQNSLADFESVASKHNISIDTYNKLLAIANNNFEVTGESAKNKSIIINNEMINPKDLVNYIEAVDTGMLTGVQRTINQFSSDKNEKFSKQQFHISLNNYLSKKGNPGAQVMVTEMALGETGSIKDQIINNFDMFAPLLGNNDLNDDGVQDSKQGGDPAVAREVVNALTKIDHPNYNSRITNDFVRDFLTKQVEITFDANKAKQKGKNNQINLQRDVFAQGNTGYFLSNFTQMIDLARQNKQADVDRIGNQVGLQLVKQKDNKYVFLQRSSLKQEKGTGIQLTMPFDINDQSDIMKNVQVLAYQSLKSNLSARVLQNYMAYLENNNDVFFTYLPRMPKRFKSSNKSSKINPIIGNAIEGLMKNTGGIENEMR